MTRSWRDEATCSPADGACARTTSLLSASAAFAREDVEPSNRFVEVLNFHGGRAYHVNYNDQTAVEKINRWASNATLGEIRGAVGPEFVRPDTKLMVINILYFKGEAHFKEDRKEHLLFAKLGLGVFFSLLKIESTFFFQTYSL